MFLSCCLLSFITCYAQDKEAETSKEISISGGIYNNRIFRFTELRKSGSFDDGPGLQYGASIMLPMDEKLSMGFGLHYIKTKNFYHSVILEPSEDSSYTHITEMVYLPVRWQYEITSWLALHVGLSINIEFQDEKNLNQNGLGILGGGLIHYSPAPNLEFGIQPELQLTSLFPVPQEFFQRHFFMAGINTRIAWRF